MVTLHEDKAFVGFLGSSECGFNSSLIGRWSTKNITHGTWNKRLEMFASTSTNHININILIIISIIFCGHSHDIFQIFPSHRVLVFHLSPANPGGFFCLGLLGLYKKCRLTSGHEVYGCKWITIVTIVHYSHYSSL